MTDDLIGSVVAAVLSARPNGNGMAWGLVARAKRITVWISGGDGQPALSIVKIEERLGWQAD